MIKTARDITFKTGELQSGLSAEDYFRYRNGGKSLQEMQDDGEMLGASAIMGIMRDYADYATRDWIPVSDPPEKFIDVLVADKHGRIYLVEYDGGNFIQTAEGEYAYDITHWMPRPPKPEEQ